MMHNSKTRLLSLFLTFVMLFGIIPVPATAAGPVADSVTLVVDSATANDDALRAEGATYKTLDGAETAATNGDTIKLMSDISCSSFIIDSKNLTIDFNGKRVTCSSTSYAINPYGTTQLTLKDSSGGDKGGVDSTGSTAVCIKAEDTSTVTIEGGSYIAKKWATA